MLDGLNSTLRRVLALKSHLALLFEGVSTFSLNLLLISFNLYFKLIKNKHLTRLLLPFSLLFRQLIQIFLLLFSSMSALRALLVI